MSHNNPSQSPEVFKQQIYTLFKEESIEVNRFLFWAEKAQNNTYNCNKHEAIQWYINAMLIYDFLENKIQKPFLSRIYMRLQIIGLYGYDHEKSRPYLEEIMEWILKGLPEKMDEIKADAEHWQQLPIEKIRALRELKMKLKIAQQLKENNIALDDQVHDYLALMNILP